VTRNIFSTHYACIIIIFSPIMQNSALPVSFSLKLVRVLRCDSFGSQQLSERTIDLNLARHEWIKLSRRSRVLRKLFLDDILNDLASVSFEETVHKVK